jgi:hypothetical protein
MARSRGRGSEAAAVLGVIPKTPVLASATRVLRMLVLALPPPLVLLPPSSEAQRPWLPSNPVGPCQWTRYFEARRKTCPRCSSLAPSPSNRTPIDWPSSAHFAIPDINCISTIVKNSSLVAVDTHTRSPEHARTASSASVCVAAQCNPLCRPLCPSAVRDCRFVGRAAAGTVCAQQRNAINCAMNPDRNWLGAGSL